MPSRLRGNGGVAFATDISAAFTSISLPDWMIAIPLDGGGAAAEVLADVSEMARDEGDAVSGRLAARLATLGTSNELRRFDLRPGETTDRVVTETRCSDLSTRRCGGIDNRLASNVIEGVLLASGHGLLLTSRAARQRIATPVASIHPGAPATHACSCGDRRAAPARSERARA